MNATSIRTEDLWTAKVLYYMLEELALQVFPEIQKLACQVLAYCQDPDVIMLLADLATEPTEERLAQLICGIEGIDPRVPGGEFYDVLDVGLEPRIRAVAAKRLLADYVAGQTPLMQFLGRIEDIEGLAVLDPLRGVSELIGPVECFEFRAGPSGFGARRYFTEAQVDKELREVAPEIEAALNEIIASSTSGSDVV